MVLKRVSNSNKSTKVAEKIVKNDIIDISNEKKRLTIYLTSKVSKELKRLGVENEQSISMLIENAVRNTYNI